MEWKPVETAPKGEWLIVWDVDDDIATMARWHHYAFRDSDGRPIVASHWMPEPEKPAELIEEPEAIMRRVAAKLESE